MMLKQIQMMNLVFMQNYNCDGSCINDFDLDGECDEVDYDDDIGINEVKAESNEQSK